MQEEITEKELVGKHIEEIVALMKAERIKQGIALKDLASRIGMDISQMSRCESGERCFKVIELVHYCGIIGYTLVPVKN